MKILLTVPVLAAAAVLAAGCDRPSLSQEGGVRTPALAAYRKPPRALGVTEASGLVTVFGQASPGSRIRGRAQDGKVYGATADGEGRFALSIPVRPVPLMLAVSEEDARRVDPADGWVFAPPGEPQAAVVLRPGAPSVPLGRSAGLLAALDYDSGGGAALSGVAAPDSVVKVAIDGAAPIEVQSDGSGVFGVRLNGRLSPGVRRITVQSGDRTASETLDLTAAGDAAAFSAARTPSGWRLTWAPPGGGAQSTFVFSGRR